MFTTNFFELTQKMKVSCSLNEKKQLLALADEQAKHIFHLTYNTMIQFKMTINPNDMTFSGDNNNQEQLELFLDTLQTFITAPSITKNMKMYMTTIISDFDTSNGLMLVAAINRNLNIGVSESSLLEVFGKGFIPTFKCALCQPYEPDSLTKLYKMNIDSLVLEPKLDGKRLICNYNIAEDQMIITGRNGKPDHTANAGIEKYVNLIASRLKDYVSNHPTLNSTDTIRIDGEIVSASNNFNDLMSTSRRKNKQENNNVYVVFTYAVFCQNEVATCGEFTRLQQLKTIMNELSDEYDDFDKFIKLIDFTIKPLTGDYDTDHLMILSSQASYVVQGYEGIIAKANTAYPMKRQIDWIKGKPFFSGDLQLVGIEESTSESINGLVGALLLEGTLENGTYIKTKCGSGMTFEDRKYITENLSTLIGRTVEVEYQEVTVNNALRFVTFKWFRDDK